MSRANLCIAAAAAAAATAGAAAACGNAPSGVVDDCTRSLELPPAVSTDILVVVDNSASMTEEQEKVAAQLETFVTTLASAPIRNDFQIGVITTSVSQRAQGCEAGAVPELTRYAGDSGRLQLGKNAGGVHDPRSTRRILRAGDADLVEQFGLLVRQGIVGSGQEMGLEAVRLALTEPLVSAAADAEPPGNAGFLRPGARLLVLIVSDEDDCSDPGGDALALEPVCGAACASDADCGATGHYCIEDLAGARRCLRNACETDDGRGRLEPVATYVDLLRGLDDGTGAGRPREVILAVIGSVDPDDADLPARCSRGGTEAQGVATRYAQAVAAMGEGSGFIDSVCRDDYGPALARIATLAGAPQAVELARAPSDGRLLQVALTRADGTEELCRHGDGFDFQPAVGAARARIVMRGRCRLSHGDALRVEIVCAG